MMTKQEVNDLVGLYKTLNTELQKLGETLTDEKEASKLDGLNRDLAIAQVHTMQALLSTITIRIGLNMSVAKQDDEGAAETQKGELTDGKEENPATEGAEPEQ